jgi:hypothetical protein
LEGNSFFGGVFFLMEKMVVYSPLTNGIVVVFGHYAQGGLGRGRGRYKIFNNKQFKDLKTFIQVNTSAKQ